MASISVENLNFTYRHGTPSVLADINVQFTLGHFALLTGPSGCGKSTLLKLIAGLYPDYAGTVEQGQIKFAGELLSDIEPTKRSRQVALLFQNPAQQFAMPTVIEELVFALENQQVAPELIADRCLIALQEVGITNLKTRVISELSGGEQQKVALAVILAMDSQVILLDEPFASVDPIARDELLKTLRRLCDVQGKTIILADHDLSGYADLVDDVFQMRKGQQPELLSEQARRQLFLRYSATATAGWSLSSPAAQQPAAFILNSTVLKQQQRTLLTVQQLKIPRDAVTLVTGPNGIGKSTLLDALVKLHPYQGQILYQKVNVQQWRANKYARQVSLLFQSAETQFLSTTVADELKLSQRHAQGTYFSDQRIKMAMQKLQIDGFEERGLYDLSEGQQKKVQILSMLIMQPAVLLLDEPLSGLDLASIEALVQLLLAVRKETHETMVIVSHQLTGLQPLVDYQLLFAEQALTFREAKNESKY